MLDDCLLNREPIRCWSNRLEQMSFVVGHMRGHKFCLTLMKYTSAVLLTEGKKVPFTTSVSTLLNNNFKLVINDTVYNVSSAQEGTVAL